MKGWVFCSVKKDGHRGENLNLFGEIFYRKINLQIRDTVYMNALNMVLLCDEFWPFGEKEKKKKKKKKRI